jgi:hypothetical protein
VRKNWHGDPTCYFCNYPETIDHLFFECPVSKVTWGVAASCFSRNDRPSTYNQYWAWISKALPGGGGGIFYAWLGCHLLGYMKNSQHGLF